MKPIYQLYDEWDITVQKCKVCSFSTRERNIEEHLRKEHLKEITPHWR